MKLERAYLPLLVISLTFNGFMIDLYHTTKREAQSADNAVKTCNKSVMRLKEAGDAQVLQAGEDLKAANKRTEEAEARAKRELTRPPAVPGNVCASAKQENREWLERRRAKP